MSKKKRTGKNAVTCGPLDLSDEQLATLGAILKDWNAQEPSREEPWTTDTVIPELVRKYLDVMEEDYGGNARKAAFEAPKPLDSPSQNG